LKEEFSTLQWINVNINNDPHGLAQKYSVTKVPTIVVDNEKGIESHTGTVAMGYYRILRNATSR
jgi:hypothetical protein